MNSTALTVKVFGDGADLAGILALAENPAIKGFTTNPTLMRQAGVDDYEAFAHEVLASVTDKPISHLILTHMHPDHVMGAAVMVEAGGQIVGNLDRHRL